MNNDPNNLNDQRRKEFDRNTKLTGVLGWAQRWPKISALVVFLPLFLIYLLVMNVTKDPNAITERNGDKIAGIICNPGDKTIGNAMEYKDGDVPYGIKITVKDENNVYKEQIIGFSSGDSTVASAAKKAWSAGSAQLILCAEPTEQKDSTNTCEATVGRRIDVTAQTAKYTVNIYELKTRKLVKEATIQSEDIDDFECPETVYSTGRLLIPMKDSELIQLVKPLIS